tara:strand:+ start:517 stop:705 length:189 start_codon:yes stop_codon:yes gene_type:complete
MTQGAMGILLIERTVRMQANLELEVHILDLRSLFTKIQQKASCHQSKFNENCKSLKACIEKP